MPDPAKPMIEFRGVTKRFGAFTAVRDVSLTVNTGEFLTLLGPSGCGKTTLLRLLAGFETPDEGLVLLDGEDVSHVPPYRRSVNQVFQSYALFPHMTVKENVGFGLRMQNIPAPEAEARIKEALATVSLAEQADKLPHQMSGGQRQRVALARAIVCRPKVLLLDEPLSALDAKLRHGMQLELKRLQRKLGLTFVFVTHDQEEALTMSDRIAIINHGRIEQLGNATEIYHRPRTPFAADFIGQANLLSAEIILRNGSKATVRLDTGLELVVACTDLPVGATKALVSIRPEKIHIGRTPAIAENVFQAKIEEEIFQGATDQLRLITDQGTRFHALVANESATQEAYHEGDRVYCSLHLDDLVIVQTE
ncbi:Spermidine/putrescine import ATP-binding protein PotA [Lacunisphaera limnophila]|uniref:Spermidine/putrescine import ATP-binding protein PotA n=1 Tax=Lacunisphaera limnophila TaxID=1838286 RepID=A0A1D8AZA3_9BACT|nr:ABC transporter ATP-binding protein [Lacunisphaera limnophila]AOS46220.1 Spermidine/putrescine import ATP-binding protein PotA [Lacunisphaera limnophila]